MYEKVLEYCWGFTFYVSEWDNSHEYCVVVRFCDHKCSVDIKSEHKKGFFRINFPIQMFPDSHTSSLCCEFSFEIISPYAAASSYI